MRSSLWKDGDTSLRRCTQQLRRECTNNAPAIIVSLKNDNSCGVEMCDCLLGVANDQTSHEPSHERKVSHQHQRLRFSAHQICHGPYSIIGIQPLHFGRKLGQAKMLSENLGRLLCPQLPAVADFIDGQLRRIKPGRNPFDFLRSRFR